MFEKIKNILKKNEAFFTKFIVLVFATLFLIVCLMNKTNRMELVGTDNISLEFYAESDWEYDSDGNIYDHIKGNEITKIGEMSVVPEATKAELQEYLFELSENSNVTKINDNTYRLNLSEEMLSYIIYNEENNTTYQLLFSGLKDGAVSKIEKSFKFINR